MTSLNRPRQLSRLSARAVGLGAVVVTVTSLGWTMARADVRVHGDGTAIEVNVSQAPVAEVITALATAFNIRYRTSIALDGAITGTYTGSLSQVLARVLDGYTYIVKHDAGRIELIVFGQRGERDIPVNVTSPAPARNPATDWGQKKR